MAILHIDNTYTAEAIFEYNLDNEPLINEDKLLELTDANSIITKFYYEESKKYQIKLLYIQLYKPLTKDKLKEADENLKKYLSGNELGESINSQKIKKIDKDYNDGLKKATYVEFVFNIPGLKQEYKGKYRADWGISNKIREEMGKIVRSNGFTVAWGFDGTPDIFSGIIPAQGYDKLWYRVTLLGDTSKLNKVDREIQEYLNTLLEPVSESIDSIKPREAYTVEFTYDISKVKSENKTKLDGFYNIIDSNGFEILNVYPGNINDNPFSFMVDLVGDESKLNEVDEQIQEYINSL